MPNGAERFSAAAPPGESAMPIWSVFGQCAGSGGSVADGAAPADVATANVAAARRRTVARRSTSPPPGMRFAVSS